MIIFLIIIGILYILFFGICAFCSKKSFENIIDGIDKEYEERLKKKFKEDEGNNTGRR